MMGFLGSIAPGRRGERGRIGTTTTCVVVGPQTQVRRPRVQTDRSKFVSGVAVKEEQKQDEVVSDNSGVVGASRREGIVFRGIVIFADYLSDLIVLDIFERVECRLDLFLVLLGSSAAFVFADLSSGIYYWFAHNYGSRATPFVGSEIQKARTLHSQHRKPQRKRLVEGSLNSRTSAEYTKDDFFINVGNHCLVSIPILTILAGWQPNNLALEAFCVMFISLMAILPQLNRWATIDSPPFLIGLIRQFGLLGSLSRYDSRADVQTDNYCVGNFWNHVLDREQVFRRIERSLYIASDGWLVPRTWRSQTLPKADAMIIRTVKRRGKRNTE
uniref:Lipid desaturase domain-containing protein n=1 Tax=Rhodosorus marinus TaxID=101924 RepID=A0A7S0G5S8_9RHOD|mmetsp:Transcript_22019/g.31889  ORF Transcript_22019/g.31889 Transcript_22019/m.31889 type:complete len:329 (+) Transcript_22019:67-1053(+)